MLGAIDISVGQQLFGLLPRLPASLGFASPPSLPHPQRGLTGAASVAGRFAVADTAAETLPLPANLISLKSAAGREILLESSARQAYRPLSMNFVTQENPSYCGVASMVMVLNSLGVRAPAAPGSKPSTAFTQDNVLNEKTERILPQSVLLKQGMTLDEFGKLMQTYGVKTKTQHAAATTVDEFRAAAVKYLGMPDHHVVVNYLRSDLGQVGGGHISPLAAYDAKTDRFLVMDVSSYKYPPAWVTTEDLFSAMNTVDKDNANQTRGFVLIQGNGAADLTAQYSARARGLA